MNTMAAGFIELGRKQAELCRQDKDTYLNLLVTAGSQRLILMNVYRVVVNENILESLESLPEENKREFWEEAKTLAAGRLPADKLKTLALCLYTICYLLERK